jgi:hypothetical protein
MDNIHHCECLSFNCGIIIFSVVEQSQCIGNRLVALFSKVLHNIALIAKLKTSM